MWGDSKRAFQNERESFLYDDQKRRQTTESRTCTCVERDGTDQMLLQSQESCSDCDDDDDDVESEHLRIHPSSSYSS